MSWHEWKYGVSAFAWTDKFSVAHLGVFEQARNQGLQCVEVAMFDPDALPVQAIRRAAEAAGVACTVCALLPAGVNPISPEEDTRKKSARHLKKCLAAAAGMGASVVGGPVLAPIGYLPPHRPTAEETGWAAEFLRGLLPAMEALDMTLCIEPVNRSETFFLRTAVEARVLCEEISHPLLGVTLDTFHANIEEKSISGAIDLLGAHLKHVHLSENDRGTLGQGHVDFAAILQALEQNSFQGHAVIEGFGFSQDETTAPGYLWSPTDLTPERFVRESVAFLQELHLTLESQGARA